MSEPRVVVVGLGPAGRDLVTAGALAAIAAIPHRYVRTTRHPSSSVVQDATSFDPLYEIADTFDDVYSAITDSLVVAAEEHGEVLYAVPGSPFVLERTVENLRHDGRVQVDVVPGLSFLDLAYARLGVDPVEAGVRLVDGHRFAVDAAGERGPLLVAHVHDAWVLSDIKLAVEEPDPEAEVVVLQRLGLPDEAVSTVAWAELDRVNPDHLTALYLPEVAEPVGQEYVRLHELARTLRRRCPWDREQTHQTLTRYLVEEAYEVIEAVESLDDDEPSTDEALIEELGDLLYQIEFHATIAEQEGRFTIADVARGIHDKLVRRHPHVFGDVQADSTDDVLASWEAIKRAEKGRASVMDGIPSHLPALLAALTVQKKASSLGFDAPDVTAFVPKVREELDELVAAEHPDHVAEEVGDLLFAVVNVARHLGVDPESSLRMAVAKFGERVRVVEAMAAERDIALVSSDLATLDALWDEAKARTREVP